MSWGRPWISGCRLGSMHCLSVAENVGIAVCVVGQLHLPFEHRSLNPLLLVILCMWCVTEWYAVVEGAWSVSCVLCV